MSFNIDRKKIGSINDGGRRLKVGTHAYRITGASMAVVKSNPTGKEKQVVFDLQDKQDPSYTCKVFLNVMSPNDTAAEIAAKTLVAFADAAGVGGNLKPERLPGFVNKDVVITTRETPGKGDSKDKSYINISTVEAYEGGDEDEDEEESEDEEEEEDETPAPAPAKASGKKRPWG